MMRRNLQRVIVILTVGILGGVSEAEFRAGAAAVNINPLKFPVVVNGGFLARYADKIVSNLHARAVVMSDGKETVCVVIVDSCIMPRDLLDKAKERASKATGIGTDKMLISATHTHSAPSALRALGTQNDENYVGYLVEKIAEAIEKAKGNMVSAKIGWTVVDANEYTAVRRWVRRPGAMLRDPFGNLTVRANMHPGHQSRDATSPSGPEDPDLSLISIQSKEGKPIALLANFANHYFSMAPVSADYFGLFADRVSELIVGEKGEGEKEEAAPFVGIMSQGTSGDVWLRDYFKPAPEKRMNIMEYANGMAEKAVAGYKQIKYQDDVVVKMSERELPLKRRLADAQRLEWARGVVEAQGDRPPKNKTEVYANEALWIEKNPSAVLKLQALRIGELGITAMPNEVYALTGLKLKRLSPLGTTVNIELANGGEGYIPGPEQHVLGGYNTWEARSAGLEVNAEPKIVETLLQLLEEVSGRERKEYAPTKGAGVKAVMDARPRAYWRLDEYGGRVAEEMVSGRSGAYEDGVVFYLEGVNGEQFNKVGELNRSPVFAGGRMQAKIDDVGKDYSVSLWMWNGIVHDVRAVSGYMFSRGVNHDVSARGDHVGVGGTYDKGMLGKLFFYNGDEKKQTVVGKTPLERWTWYHVVLVREGERVKLYLDGRLEGEGVAAATWAEGNKDYFVGGRNDNLFNWEGRLDEAAVFDRALKAEEIEKLYEAGSGKKVVQEEAFRPDAPALSAEDSMKKIHLQEGWEIELMVKEPLVKDPVGFSWGVDGKLWVVEMADYPIGIDGKMKSGGRIRVLSDEDGDGQYDKSVLFMDGVNFPNGVLPWRKGVLVSAAPEIFYAEDTDGDGKADLKEVILTGFSEGNPQLRINGLRWGLDNMVYCANGLSSRGKVKSLKTGKVVDISGRDLRFDPDTGEVETLTGPSQFGRVRDDWGNWFGVQNSYPLIHVMMEEKYAKRNPYYAPQHTKKILIEPRNPVVYAKSEFIKRYDHPHRGRLLTSACGIEIYRGGVLFGGDGLTHGITCEPYHNMVLHVSLKDSGVTYDAKIERTGKDGKQEFLASEDHWFRPVYAKTGPGGGIWIADMYRYIIEHPQYMPPHGREKLRAYYRLGEDKGRIYRLKKKGVGLDGAMDLSKKNGRELVELLKHENGTVRDLVHMMLVWRGKDEKALKALKALKQLPAREENDIQRVHGMWVLDAWGELTTWDLRFSNGKVGPELYVQKIRLAEKHGWLDNIKFISNDHEKVKQQLLLSLGAFKDKDAGIKLKSLMGGLNDNDSALFEAGLTSAGAHVDTLANTWWKMSGRRGAELRDLLLRIGLRKNDRGLLVKLFGKVLPGEGEKFGMSTVRVVSEMMDVMNRERVTIEKLKAGGGDGGDELTALLGRFGEVFNYARGKARGEPAAVKLLGYEKEKVEGDIALLSKLVGDGGNREIQMVGVDVLSRVGTDAALGVLMGKWGNVSPGVSDAIREVMMRDSRRVKLMLEGMKQGVVGVHVLDAARREQLVKHKDAGVRELAKVVLKPSEGSRTVVVEQYAEALKMEGDYERGKVLFSQLCAVCHRVDEVGKEIGPNLRSVTDQSGRGMLENILDPNRSIEPKYMSYLLTKKNGESVLGIVTEESGNAVTMVGLDGVAHQVLRSEIGSLKSTGRSLMPEGLEGGMDVQGMSDLLLYLKGK